MSRTAATYLYCLVRSEGAFASTLAGAPAGLPRASPPRALSVGEGLWLIAADVPLPEYGADEIQRRLQEMPWVSERALAHEAMVEHFLAAGTVVPMKLFTLFATDERAVEHVRSGRERLDRVLDRIAGCSEWGVRVHFDPARAREAVAGDARREAEGHSAGKGFLLRKKAEQEATRNLASRLGAEADGVFTELAGQAADASRRGVPPGEAGGTLLLDAAFLVPTGRAAEFEEAVGRAAARLRDRACELTLTGPWPPYNFLEEAP